MSLQNTKRMQLKVKNINPTLVSPASDGSVNGYSALDLHSKNWIYQNGNIYNQKGLPMKFPHMQIPNEMVLSDTRILLGMFVSLVSIMISIGFMPYGLLVLFPQLATLLIMMLFLRKPKFLIDEFNQYTKNVLKIILLIINLFFLIFGFIMWMDGESYYYGYYHSSDWGYDLMVSGIISMFASSINVLISFSILQKRKESGSTILLPKPAGLKKLMEMAKNKGIPSVVTSSVNDDSILQEIADSFLNSR